MTNIDETNIRRLDFGLLLVLRELLHHRRTTEAAKRLGLSQSAVSHALARLRDLTGDPLFIRRSDGLQPTSAALALLPQVEALIAGGQALLGVGNSFDPRTADRRFRLAANDFVASVLAPRLRRALALAAPAVRFTVHFAVGVDAIAALRQDKVDLALGYFPAGSEACIGTLLSDEDYALVALPGHAALDPALDVEGYCALDHVLVSFRGRFSGTVDAALERVGASRRVVTSVPTFLTALTMVADSDLVATVPRRLAHEHAHRFGLAVRAVPFQIAPFDTSLLRHRRESGSLALDWLSGVIQECWPDLPKEIGQRSD